MPGAAAPPTTLPRIIQGGMGIGVSGWRLARAVSRRGQLGVVSGCDSLFVRQLQDGDAGGHLWSAMQRFPIPGVAAAARRAFLLPEGRAPGAPYRLLPMQQQVMSRARQQLIMLAAFVEVALAKDGHESRVGMNLLTKVQMPILPTLYGAMLAGVDYILMGAGIPREIPGALDALAEGREAKLRLDVDGDASGAAEYLRFDPAEHFEGSAPPVLKRPDFLAIVASHALAVMLARKATGRVNGFVIEGPRAGGHNAPPRSDTLLSERGEPVYGERDDVDLGRIRDLGLPFWIAGGTGHPDRLRKALDDGAAGIQVGGLFACCDESGIEPGLRRSIVECAARGEVDVFTDPLASPTGYPFKVVRWPADPSRGVTRQRRCDIGYLRVAYRKPSGGIGYRCPSEPVSSYVAKGGLHADTDGRRCLCNALMATVGSAQVAVDGSVEPPLVTGGDDLKNLAGFLGSRSHYSAADVIDWLLGARG